MNAHSATPLNPPPERHVSRHRKCSEPAPVAANGSLATNLLHFSNFQCAAFSLVEVVLAIGIVSFALLVIIGVFQGVMKTSGENTQRREIVEAIDSLRRTLQTEGFTNAYSWVRDEKALLYVAYRATPSGLPATNGTSIATAWFDPSTNSNLQDYDAARTGRWMRARLRTSPSNPGGTNLSANPADWPRASLWAAATIDSIPVPDPAVATNSGTLETTLSILR